MWESVKPLNGDVVWTQEQLTVGRIKVELAELAAEQQQLKATLTLKESEAADAINTILAQHSSASSSDGSIRRSRRAASLGGEQAEAVQKLKAGLNAQKAEIEGQLKALHKRSSRAQEALRVAVRAPLSDGQDPTQWLPDELMIAIFLVAPFRRLWHGGCALVCRRWHALVNCPKIRRYKRANRWSLYRDQILKPVSLPSPFGNDVRLIVFGPDGTMYTAYGSTIVAFAGDMITPKFKMTYVGNGNPAHWGPTQIVVGSNSKLYASTRPFIGDSEIQAWSTADGSSLAGIKDNHDLIRQERSRTSWAQQRFLALCNKNELLYSAYGFTIQVLSCHDGSEVRISTEHTKAITALLAHPSDGRLFSADQNSIKVWSEAGVVTMSLDILGAIGRKVFSMAFSGSTQRLYAVDSSSLRIWSIDDGSLLGLVPYERERRVGYSAQLALDDDTGRVVLATGERLVQTWGGEMNKRFRPLERVVRCVNVAAFGPDGRLYTADSTIRMW